ncbi:hypothetical protein H310_02537 [Aphanomyces invadans]|uniref:Uncharacterized protein n=1 Tax=Aphanomyces invadans TaxID=157072 RepID=A0A024UIG0_9STRA|nr:hypothetical protein H310_02537 [Aphanomyces invadans]ETW06236.1 hypothetical protein H310_02537 [Aphanomyces invadans]|eukprot:XP_008864311.1 hypothetical protein H310_02537 [Aphanomyces invadans]
MVCCGAARRSTSRAHERCTSADKRSTWPRWHRCRAVAVFFPLSGWDSLRARDVCHGMILVKAFRGKKISKTRRSVTTFAGISVFPTVMCDVHRRLPQPLMRRAWAREVLSPTTTQRCCKLRTVKGAACYRGLFHSVVLRCTIAYLLNSVAIYLGTDGVNNGGAEDAVALDL